MDKMPDPQLVFITGDQTVDWAVYPAASHNSRNGDERLHVSVKLLWHKGGVFLLEHMIKDAISAVPGYRRGGYEPDCAGVPPDISKLTAYGSGYNHSFAVLREYEEKGNDQQQVYRVDQYLGFRHIQDQQGGTNKQRFKRKNFNHKVLVIDDADLGFRDSPSYWSKLIPDRSIPARDAPWIVLKMSHNIVCGNLWKSLHRRLSSPGDDWIKDKLIVITAVARLRDNEAEISRDLSWLRSAYDALAEIGCRSSLKDLTDCRRLIVSFGPTGAILTDRTVTHNERPRLIYNHEIMEGEWMDRHKNGMMFGYGSVLCASVVAELINSERRGRRSPDLSRAVRQGLTAMQRLYDRGFTKPNPGRDNGARSQKERIAEGEFFSPSGLFLEITKDESYRLFDEICLDRHPEHNINSSPSQFATINNNLDLDSPLFDIARRGKAALEECLHHVPIAVFGKLITADQDEIEGLHSISNLIETYCDTGRDLLKSKPLAIAVFGNPGDGKSYTIEQLTKRWSDEGVVESSTYNLSQFGSPVELVGALHQVRDVALSGKVPIAFWDEFDAPLNKMPLGWLRYFLGPIQDGKFQQEETAHLIGPSIFAFAGGTSYSYAEFCDRVEGAKPDTKASDFLSRLRGFIDVAGVNSASPWDRPSKEVMLRRALILNSLFDKHDVAKGDGDGFVVDSGILRAFLSIPTFNHGARSMEAIIQMGRRRKREPFKRSSLPSEAQLSLHVDGVEFLERMREE